MRMVGESLAELCERLEREHCGGMGLPDDGGADAERERARAQAVSEAVERAGVPKRYRDARDDAKTGEMLRWLALDPPVGAFVTGETGTGKTYLASALAVRYVERGMVERAGMWCADRTVRYINPIRTLDQLRDMPRTSGSVAGAVEALSTCDLLVVDDLGKESPTRWVFEKLFSVFDRRYSEMLPTVVTTQWTKAELIERMGMHEGIAMRDAEALVSRLHETCRAVRLEGRNRRLAVQTRTLGGDAGDGAQQA